MFLFVTSIKIQFKLIIWIWIEESTLVSIINSAQDWFEFLPVILMQIQLQFNFFWGVSLFNLNLHLWMKN